MAITDDLQLDTGHSIYSDIVEAFLLGQDTGGGNLVNLKTSSTHTSTYAGSASVSSDADGDYLDVTSTAASERVISTTIARSGSAYSIILTAKLDTTSPSNYAGLFSFVDASNNQLASLQYAFSALGLYHNNDDLADLSSAGWGTALQTFVVTWDGTDAKLYRTSVSSASAGYTATPGTGTNMNRLRVGNERTGGVSWPGQYYFIARTNTAIGATAAQSIANNVEQLLVASAPPTAPTGVTAGSVTALSATCSWTDTSGDETGFKVQYAPSPYSSWTTLGGSPTAANATSLATGNVLTDGTSYKFRVASTNANGDSAYVESGVFTTPALTRLRPNADTTVGAWTPSTGSTLFGVIDEAVADDADYITTASATTGKVKVEVSTDPADDTNHSVSIRARATSGTLTVSLVQGHPSETLIKAWTPSLTSSFATYVLTMSSGEAAGITDYSDLYLKFVTT